MVVCVECGSSVGALYSSYGKDNIVLERCKKCDEIVDKYIEFDRVIKAIDLVLHKAPVYRHILLNSSLKISNRQAGLFLVYLGMVEIYLLQPQKMDITRFFTIFCTTILCNLSYLLITWLIMRICALSFSFRMTKFEILRNALILGSFPQLMHLLFVIWDYPRDVQFYNVISIATFTSHLIAISSISIYPNSTKITLLAISLAQIITLQLKRLLL